MGKQEHKQVAWVRAAVARGLVAATLWWMLTEGADAPAFGSLAVLLTVVASLALAPPAPALRISLLGFLRFVGTFVLRSVAAGAQVARLALAPRLALRPARISVETHLPAGLPRVLLANTLTLQPGTLAVCLEDARLLVHVLDETPDLEPEVRALEARIAAMLRLT
ncbi:MAG: Na+/H+ antiporter subunit E [Pseudomonadales bacterium]|nr:Na+/H+ antiporter subunit E [Pseudomonadales bacterium]